MVSDSPQVLVVISDLHISAGALDDCDSVLEALLVDFLVSLTRRSTAVELVINGDFLDFVQAPPWQGPELSATSPDGVPLCFTQAQSLEKLDAIVGAHPRVFRGLRDFVAADTRNRITILPGNHDADLYWPEVQIRVKSAVGGSTEHPQVAIHADRVYRPNLRPSTWIEHGHQYDPTNRFFTDKGSCWASDNPPIFLDANGIERLYECVGTRFLIRFINRLDRDYPFVDNVKPFSRFLRVFGASALRPGNGPLNATLATMAMLRFLGTTVLHSRSDLLRLENDGDADSEHPLMSVIDALSHEDRKKVEQALAEAGVQLDRPLRLWLEDPDIAER